MPSSLDLECAVITGSAGGIGRAMAEYLLKQGREVIIVGRTESKLQETAKAIGATAYYTLDTGAIDTIPAFVDKLTKDHPNVDCLINNAGVQFPLSLPTLPASDFISKSSSEIDINIRGPLALSSSILPHFKTRPSASIMNITSGLAYTPFLASCPVYCATKAFMHSFSMNLRSQLAADASTKHIRVIEVVPPLVETDLHREHADPDNNKKEKQPMAMSLEEFVSDVVEGWEKGEDTVAAGMAKRGVGAWFDAFGKGYERNTILHS